MLAHARRCSATLGHTPHTQCTILHTIYLNGKSRRLSSTSTIDTRTVLSKIQEFTTKHPVSIFRSRSVNPYHNLAIENYLLKRSEPKSRVLFTYTNRPCVVFGRNQNPWLECNIAKVQEGLRWCTAEWTGNKSVEGFDSNSRQAVNELVPLDLVRRRSGGGTVIHDVGNLNFSFIVPNDKDFTRDNNAWLVVSVLKEYQRQHHHHQQGSVKVLFDKIRVNERHDIVMTRDLKDEVYQDTQEYKASGSAYKLTRGRALHHGTLLHSSPNVRQPKEREFDANTFSTLLSSPGKPFLHAKGVGSVRSPVHNLFSVDSVNDRRNLVTALEDCLGSTFGSLHEDHNVPRVTVGDDDCQWDANIEIHDDVQEMLTNDWRFCQTPSFEYESLHSEGQVKLHFEVKHGIIRSPKLHTRDDSLLGEDDLADIDGKKLHEVRSWDSLLPESPAINSASIKANLATTFPEIHLVKADSRIQFKDRILEEQDTSASSLGETAIKRKSRRGVVEVEKAGQNVIME